MRIAICDDERIHSSVLERIIKQWAAFQEEVVKVRLYDSGEAFMKDFDRGVKFDVVFLDIQMGGISGIDLAKHIREWDMSIMIVFCTNFRDYVFEGYEVSALRYLIKPIKERKCIETLNVISEACKKKQTGHFTVKTETTTHRIAKSDIVHISSSGHYLYAHTFDAAYKFRGKLTQIEEDFAPPMYTKCNRGILINLAHVNCITRETVTMTNQEELPVSRNYYEDLNRCYLAVHVEPVMAARRNKQYKDKELGS